MDLPKMVLKHYHKAQLLSPDNNQVQTVYKRSKRSSLDFACE